MYILKVKMYYELGYRTIETLNPKTQEWQPLTFQTQTDAINYFYNVVKGGHKDGDVKYQIDKVRA